MNKSMRALRRALQIAKGPTNLARMTGYRQTAISNAVARSTLTPDMSAAVERATGVPVEDLRPDLVWYRVADPRWTAHPAGRPALDLTVSRHGLAPIRLSGRVRQASSKNGANTTPAK